MQIFIACVRKTIILRGALIVFLILKLLYIQGL